MSDDLPQGWASTRVGGLFRSHGGGTPDRSNQSFWNGAIPWLSSGDIKSPIITSSSESITASALAASAARTCRPGSVIVVVRSGILKHTLPVAVLRCSAAINQDIKCFDSGDDSLNEWLALAWRASARSLLGNNREGTTVQSVKTETLANFTLPVPPLNEQRRIVAKLEQLLARVDACQRRLEKIPGILKRFRQSVLAAACSGRLTADWRDEHGGVTAHELLASVSSARPAKHRDFSVRADLDLPDLPEPCCWANLRFLLSPDEAFCYGVVQPGANDPDGAFLIRAGDLCAGRVATHGLRRIPRSVHDDYVRSQLRGGEILVTVVGAGIGESAIAQPECSGFNIARAVAKLPVREFEAAYVLLWLNSARAISWMKGDSREVARPTLNLEQLQTLPVPIAPLAEQREIVRRVDALFAFADRIETRFAKARTQVDKLTPALLAKAFRGDLVPQDPDDEPASALLDRIRAGRVSDDSPQTRRRSAATSRQSAAATR